MGLFNRKPKIIKEIYAGTWGHLINDHGFTSEVLCDDIRCVDKPGVKDGSEVSFLRIFSLRDVKQNGVTIAGWETFDQHPELIMFEGYLDFHNKPHLERKTGTRAD